MQLPLGPRFGVQQLEPRLSEKNGVVYTKPWVVELILDLAGYTADRDLGHQLAIEPAFGDGAFLLPMVNRLLAAARRDEIPLAALETCLIAYELEPSSAGRTHQFLVERLVEQHNVDAATGRELVKAWIHVGDYLLDAPLLPQADYVIGNPPYIRPEDIDPGQLADYRRAYPTMMGRADIYVAFYEAALRGLNDEGVCAFICADRWMANHYGRALRELVTSRFSVEAVVEMHHADAFAEEVSAYPAITIIHRRSQRAAIVASLNSDQAAIGGKHLAQAIRNKGNISRIVEAPLSLRYARLDGWFSAGDPWPLVSPEHLALLQRLEAEFPPLEDAETGTKVTIGVATGADPVFITQDSGLVESERLLPLAMAKDTISGALDWSGHYLVNPWEEQGLVELDRFPRLQSYFEDHAEQLRGRHVAKKRPANWYRTIDRVHVDLTSQRKLYIPDIKERLLPVLDRGETYPHHNLYVVLSEGWDLEVLGGLLLSEIAQFFVECYAVRMRGGYLRFQAQYLRRIRVPEISSIAADQAEGLRQAFRRRDAAAATAIACQLYGIERWPVEEVPNGV